MKDHSRVVRIGNMGVAFPDHMTDDEIVTAARTIYQRQSVDPKTVLRLVNSGSRLVHDAEQVTEMIPAENRPAFRDAVRDAIKEKASGNPIKARKLFYSMSDTARSIFGDTYDHVRKEFDRASKAASIDGK